MLCIAILVVNLDNTILNVALPTLVRDLHATSSELQWIVDSYALVFAGLLLVAGSVADRYGRKRLFLCGLATFAVGSLGGAFAGSVDLLIFWRAVMGLGAALTMPSTLSIINDLYPDPAGRARAIGIWGGSSALGVAIGPLAGGFLLDHYWWGSIFLVNVPIIAAGIVGGVAVLPSTKNEHARRPDPLGGMLSVAALALILWAIIAAPTHGWLSTSVLVSGGLGLGLLVVFIGWEWRCTHPMLNLAFYRSPRFSAATSSLALGVFGLFGALFVQTQFLQFDLGFSPLQAGVRILPVALVVGITAPFSTLVVRGLGSKVVAAGGLLALSGGLLEVARVSSATTTYGDVVPGLLLIGFGAGLLMPTATDSVLGSLPRGDSAVGSATNGVSIQVGGALGVAVIGSLLSTRYRGRMEPLLAPHHVPHAISDVILGSVGGALRVADALGGTLGHALAVSARTAFMSGTALSLTVAAAMAACGAVVALLAWPARAGPRPPECED